MNVARVVEQRVVLSMGTLACAVSLALLVTPLSHTTPVVFGAVLVTWIAAVKLDRHRRLRSLLTCAPARIGNLTLEEFGVRHSPIAGELFPTAPPPYVLRPEQDAKLDRTLEGNRFVVIQGASGAGKTRALYEAIERVFPDRKVLRPKDPTEGTDPVGSLLLNRWLVPRRASYMLVIDDLDSKISALRGYAIRKWLKAHPNSLMVATTSIGSWTEELSSHPTALTRSAGRLMGLAAVVPVEESFNGESLRQARATYLLPENRDDLGPYLVLADHAVTAFAATGSPDKAPMRSLAVAAINCARAGLVRPLPLHRLLAMAEQICARDRIAFAKSDWDEAVEFCLERPEVEGSILQEHGNAPDGSLLVSANPVLVELMDRVPESEGGGVDLPDPVWRTIIEVVAEGSVDLLRIATAAGWRRRPDLADEILRKLAESGDPGAAIAAIRLEEPNLLGKPYPVTNLLERAAIGPDPRFRGLGRASPAEAAEEPAEGAVFDPTFKRSTRVYSYYRHRVLRDAIRFMVLLVCDAVAVCTGIFTAQQVSVIALPDSGGLVSSSIVVSMVATAFAFICFLLFGLYRADRDRARLGEILKSTGLTATALGLWALGSGYELVNIPLALAAAAGASLLAFLFRWVYDMVSRAWVRHYGLQSRTLLVASQRPRATAELITAGCRRPMQMLGYVSDRSIGGEPGRLGRPDALSAIIEEHLADRVIIADPALTPGDRLPLIYECQGHDVEVATDVVPNEAELFEGMSEALDEIVTPLINVPSPYLNYIDKATKRVLDVVIATPLCLIAILVLGPIVFLRKLRWPQEPVFDVEYRPGLAAVVFRMWRLRTQRGGRPTRFGRFLERFRIDELPQVFNVLGGTMSMVGPRPLSRMEMDVLDPYQLARYAVLPGITGLWQVARRKESSLDDMSNLDIVYCRKWTALLDLTILLRTIPAVLTAPPEPI